MYSRQNSKFSSLLILGIKICLCVNCRCRLHKGTCLITVILHDKEVEHKNNLLLIRQKNPLVQNHCTSLLFYREDMLRQKCSR